MKCKHCGDNVSIIRHSIKWNKESYIPYIFYPVSLIVCSILIFFNKRCFYCEIAKQKQEQIIYNEKYKSFKQKKINDKKRQERKINNRIKYFR